MLYARISARITRIQFQMSCKPERLSDVIVVRARRHERFLGEMLKRLALINLIVPADYAEYQKIRRRFDRLGKVGPHLERIFGDFLIRRPKSGSDPVVAAFLKRVSEQSARSRVTERRARLVLAMSKRVSQGWYVVFNSLHVSPDHYDRVFKVGSLCFKAYLRRYARLCGCSSESDPDHEYFAVVEEGGTTGRLHLHVLHMTRRPPRGAFDPNRRLEQPYRREIDCLKTLWLYGHSAPIACRFGSRDAWGLLGYRWPVEEAGFFNGQLCYSPIKVGHPVFLARYLAKYVSKPQPRKLLWRTRMTRNLGLIDLQKAMMAMTAGRLLTLSRVHKASNLKVNDLVLPLPMVKRLAKRELLRRLLRNSMRRSQLMMRLPALRPQPSFVRRGVDLIRLTPSLSWSSMPFTVTLRSSSMAISDLLRELETIISRSVAPALLCSGPLNRGA